MIPGDKFENHPAESRGVSRVNKLIFTLMSPCELNKFPNYSIGVEIIVSQSELNKVGLLQCENHLVELS